MVKRSYSPAWRAHGVALLVLLGACTSGTNSSNNGGTHDTPGPGGPAPTLTLTANPSTVASGASSTLSWSSSNTTACSASGSWNGAKATTDSETLSNLTGSGTYTLTCTGANGSTSRSATITVNNPAPPSPPPPGGNPLETLRNQTPNTWGVVSRNALQDVFPAPWPPGATGPRSVIDAWGGGAYDTTRDRLLIYGGGHTDYAGNEVYAFDLASGYWQRLTAPSADIGGDYRTGRYPDGNPRAVHTYNTLAYLPSVDRLMLFGMAGPYPAGAELNNTWALDLTATPPSWSERAPVPVPGYGTGGVPVFDSVTGRVWYHGHAASHLAEYDPGTNTWTRYPTSSTALEIYGTAALDPTRRKMILVGGYGGARTLVLWDLNAPQSPPTRPSTAGATALETASAVGFVFDPQGNRFLGWNGGTTVYALTPDTATWTALTWTTLPLNPANSVTPGTANGTGTYGRLRYVPSVHGLIVVNSTSGAVYFYKL